MKTIPIDEARKKGWRIFTIKNDQGVKARIAVKQKGIGVLRLKKKIIFYRINQEGLIIDKQSGQTVLLKLGIVETIRYFMSYFLEGELKIIEV